MPLDVNEIAIIMRVRNDTGADAGDGDEPYGRNREDLEDVINECVRRVLEALKMERER